MVDLEVNIQHPLYLAMGTPTWMSAHRLELSATMAVNKVFEALSSVPRRRMLAYLSKADMTAGQIVARFADTMSAPAVSKHLSILENAGLVWREKRGQNVHYGLRDETLAGTLMQFLSEICPGARPYLDDSHQERIRRDLKAAPTTAATAVTSK